MLLEDTVKLVSEHVKVVHLDITDFVSFLHGHGLEHVNEGQGPRQQSPIQTILEA